MPASRESQQQTAGGTLPAETTTTVTTTATTVTTNNNTKTSKPVIHVTFSEDNIEHLLSSEPPVHSPSVPSTLSKSPSSSSSEQMPILKKVHRRTSSMESHDNPFTQEGELSQKADFILKHSKISRTEVRISDPDGKLKEAEPEQVELMEAQTASQTHAAPPSSDINGVSEPAADSEQQTKVNNVKENGKADADGTAEQPKEGKKKKDKKKKCCVVQ